MWKELWQKAKQIAEEAMIEGDYSGWLMAQSDMAYYEMMMGANS